ncbi:tRNA pseudouridine(13) synthase TruD [Tolumonas lignilytica]|uniref:tRNA pseudouridine(13) synthase TruD n=1 Tax=Tolumonas lignilytica TaxID=1283284 RepID=UPI0004643EA1|nr:tRNA pseudouridine(13) synthase TruD [Tolumonas lignilytica]
MSKTFDLDWPYRFGKPEKTALLKAEPADFQVIEDLGFTLSGQGEHLFVRIRKTSENTAWVAKLLAEHIGIPLSAVSWAGLKDRHAVTEQWFGLHLPGKSDPDLSGLQSDTIQVLQTIRHDKKLRPGALRGNFFCLRLRELSQSRDLDMRLQQISQLGVPNYFGPQRFGHNGNNLLAAEEMFAGRRVHDRQKRSIYLSAARSYIFNQVVAARVRDNCLHEPMLGDCLLFNNSDDYLIFDKKMDKQSIAQRIEFGELVTSAPLWGVGENLSQRDALTWESAVLAAHSDWLRALELSGMQQERRKAVLRSQDLRWRWLDNGLELHFSLSAGSYATSLIRELVITRENSYDENFGQQ